MKTLIFELYIKQLSFIFRLFLFLTVLPDTEGWIPFIIRKVKRKDVYDVDMPSDKILDKVLNNLETRRNYDKPAKGLKYPDNKVCRNYSIHKTIHIFFIRPPFKLIF